MYITHCSGCVGLNTHLLAASSWPRDSLQLILYNLSPAMTMHHSRSGQVVAGQVVVGLVQCQGWVTIPGHIFVLYSKVDSQIKLSDYFDYFKHCDVFFTIVMLMLVCHNDDSYSGFKDP